jgi:hypothetical protein
MVDIEKLKASIAKVKEITGKTEAPTTVETTTTMAPEPEAEETE